MAAPAYGFELVAPSAPLRLRAMDVPRPGAGDVIVQVAGCGVCHTDIGFARGDVPTRKPLPMVLGHEIAGRVVAAGERATAWLGSNVIVPAVIACGQCAACRAGHSTICRNQFMPGNDGDGGFATHVRIPARGLCPVPNSLPPGITLESLAVVADAVSTPFEAIRRSGLQPGEVAVIVGAGGIGGFGVQIAAARGATVIAIDVDAERLRLAAEHGAALALNAAGVDEKQIKGEVLEAARRAAPGSTLKIFEMSGTAAGQRTAFSLLTFGAYMAVVGFTLQKIELRLSNLMAFDATLRGNWGCPADQYPAALDLVLAGQVKIEPFIERHPLAHA
ncbi:MAG: 6-hydroxycyclohex-1-ene-1-carbonyl-CoA dehydrogenase, partial [Acidobacteria bacterium]|nr:6-hydroxycyclohex-1-ene-1-carbonyl-CoA dehydrogenase [Acidobacteriota bacterium]